MVICLFAGNVSIPAVYLHNGYELQKSRQQGEEAAFLTEIRTPEKEAERLERIQNEFIGCFADSTRWVALPGTRSQFSAPLQICNRVQLADKGNRPVV